MTISVESLVAGGIAIGSALVVLMRLGLVTFGRPVERRRSCDTCRDHAAVMGRLREERDDLRSDVVEIKQALARLEEDLGRRIDELARMIHDHIGYCRGVQERRQRDGV